MNESLVCQHSIAGKPPIFLPFRLDGAGLTWAFAPLFSFFSSQVFIHAQPRSSLGRQISSPRVAGTFGSGN
jgi:hypothetical protein